MGCVSVPKQGEGGDSARVKVWRSPVSGGLCRAGHSRAEVTYQPKGLPCDTREAGVANTEGARAGMSPWVWAGTAGMGGGLWDSLYQEGHRSNRRYTHVTNCPQEGDEQA